MQIQKKPMYTLLGFTYCSHINIASFALAFSLHKKIKALESKLRIS